MSEFPKDRSFPRSQPGRAALTPIGQDSSLVWLRKRRFTAEARNRGGKLEVKDTGFTGLDGWYALGYVGSIQRVVGDDDARGAFKDRGPFISEDGFDPTSSNLIRYRGMGFGLANSAASDGFTVDENGLNCQIFDITSWITTNGVKFKPLYGYYVVRVNVKPGFTYLSGTAATCQAAVHGPPGAREKDGLGTGVVVMFSDFSWSFIYVRDRGGDNQYLTAPVTVAGQRPFNFFPLRVSPTTIVGLGTYLRSELPEVKSPGVPWPAPPDNTECPGYSFQFSDDNGEHWFEASSTEFFSEFDDTMNSLPPFDPGSGTWQTIENACYNFAIVRMSLAVAPISATKAICVGVVGYMDTPTPVTTNNVKGKVKLGIVDSASRTITSTMTLFDGDLRDAELFAGPVTPVEGGVVFVTFPSGGGGDGHLNHPQYHFTPDGVSISSSPIHTDWVAYRTGNLMSFSPKEIGTTIYDPAQGYILMSSKDRGVTWKQRAVVSPDGLPPNVDDELAYMLDFGTVTQLRDKSAPANSMPGAPWAANSAIDPPVL